MRRLTLGLLCATYLCLSLIVSLTLWRNGGGWGAGVAALVGGLGLCLAFHGLIERALETGQIKGDVETIREAHRILLTQVEALDARVTEIFEAVADDAQRSDDLLDEVHMLETLVQRMQTRLDEQGDAPAFPARLGGDARQTPALLDTVREALTENRVDLYLQPIVALPQRRTRFYESFSRLRDDTGRVMMPAEYLTVAEPGGLVTAIDNLLLFRCVQIVRRLAKQDRKIGIFCNVSMASLGDESFFPQFLDLLTANRDLAGALIFEVGQAAFDARGSVEARNMGKLADLGFRFSLDKVTDLDLDWQDLARSDVKFLKIAAQVLLDELTEVDGRLVLRSLPDLAAEDFTQLTRRYGVEVIAEKIEAERQVVDLLDLNLDYGQGHLFGEPRAIKEAVLTEAGPPPNLIRPQFRDTLPRRAAFG
ncbi:EAL domain-containing protein [Phenylobacterium sp.]|jgi:cyclic-di-GMP phosphodiesterase TipF (flagellum assembly factor)|uniref:flagella assembly cyclic-di-GMP phosphodiesterase TipF n=1 Tax=Phenylobacterium sp. TaxID=1871053 RepID=UPI002E347639|nr:EAL domain-containing protein [Phenylobacterium sp.]HEX3365662.1 EAL domain-containing protein [Phenylobacterium sp.]